MAALGSVARRWAGLCNGNHEAHSAPTTSTSATASASTASESPGASVPRLLPNSAASVTTSATALAASSAVGSSAAARPPAQASAFYLGSNAAPQSHCSGLAQHTDPTTCYSISDILPGQPGGTQGEQVGDVFTSRLPAAIADDAYYESVCGMHAAAPDSPHGRAAAATIAAPRPGAMRAGTTASTRCTARTRARWLTRAAVAVDQITGCSSTASRTRQPTATARDKAGG